MGWWLTAKPGDRVVCITSKFYLTSEFCGRHGITLPKKGAVYTLRVIGQTSSRPASFSLLLREIVNQSFVIEGIDCGEPHWPVGNFRPAVNRATDISIFTAMLTGKPAKADA
jgi:hypothetical protein